MNVAIKVILFIGGILATGGMFAIFDNVLTFISPTLPIHAAHSAAYTIMHAGWTAIPFIIVIGLIIILSRKEEQIYHGGYY